MHVDWKNIQHVYEVRQVNVRRTWLCQRMEAVLFPGALETIVELGNVAYREYGIFETEREYI
jgi:hypothetical protein